MAAKKRNARRKARRRAQRMPPALERELRKMSAEPRELVTALAEGFMWALTTRAMQRMLREAHDRELERRTRFRVIRGGKS